jgi:hypothetical protein
LAHGELAIDEVGKVLYLGFGSNGVNDDALSVIPVGGSGAFLNLSGNDGVVGIKTFEGEIHVPAPVQPTQAATKAYVAQVIAQAISRAFLFKGEISAATNTLPTSPVIGHIYKVSAEGNFGGAVSVTASVGDFVIYNGSGWDKIDNTDPTFIGTDDRIVVSRLGENSYQIDLAGSFVGGSNLTRLGTITQGVWQASIIPLVEGGTGVDLSSLADQSMVKKVGSAFVPAVAGEDYISRYHGRLSGGRW